MVRAPCNANSVAAGCQGWKCLTVDVSPGRRPALCARANSGSAATMRCRLAPSCRCRPAGGRPNRRKLLDDVGPACRSVSAAPISRSRCDVTSLQSPGGAFGDSLLRPFGGLALDATRSCVSAQSNRSLEPDAVRASRRSPEMSCGGRGWVRTNDFCREGSAAEYPDQTASYELLRPSPNQRQRVVDRQSAPPES
jgi:hypothetical protein